MVFLVSCDVSVFLPVLPTSFIHSFIAVELFLKVGKGQC